MHAVYARQPVRAPIAVSLMLSVVVHVGLVGTAATVLIVRETLHRYFPSKAPEGDRANEAASVEPDPAGQPPDASEVVWIRPGIDDGAADSRAWIGFADESEHVAFTADVDQSAMTTEPPGMQGEDEVPSPASAAASPAPLAGELPNVPAPEPALEQTPPAPAVGITTPETEVRESAAPTPTLPAEAPEATSAPPAPTAPPPPPSVVLTTLPDVPEAPSPEEEVDDTVREEAELAEEHREEELDPRVIYGPPRPEQIEVVADRTPVEAEAPPAAEAAGPPAPPVAAEESPSASRPASPAEASATSDAEAPSEASAPATPAGSPGDPSDKEADATSIKQAVEYRHGRVKAGAGIDIKTVKPEFSNFTVLTALPRVPVVEITFSVSGKVKNVRMVQSSGYKDVDEPILNAVWAWTAKGKKLEQLARENPQGVLKLSVRMLL